MNYTQAQIDRANAVSLEDFLRSQGEQLLKSGREYRWKEHDSLTVRGNKWFRHSQSKGGYNEVEIQRGMTTSSTAIFIPFMTRELRMAGPSLYPGIRRIRQYLVFHKGIDPALISKGNDLCVPQVGIRFSVNGLRHGVFLRDKGTNLFQCGRF